LQAELEFARIAAAKLRLDVGAGAVGTLELGPFNLPNPGGGDDLIENANLVLVAGHRYGLIGRNGKGKSTLLKFLASRRVGGLDPSLSVHYVSQEVSLTAENEKQPPVDLVLQADVQRRILLKEQAELVASGSSPEKLETVVEHLTAIDADGAPARAAQLLSNLGFSETLAKRPMEALSGGWRVRASLAAALFAKPDILLLDEPTNHLSIAAVLWLSQELSQSPVWASRVMVVVSHDRHFLDDCTTDSLHISGAARRVTLHNMSYSAWAKKRKEQQMTLERKVALRKEKIETLQEYAGHGFRYGGSSSQIGKMKQKLKESKKLEEEGADEANEMADLVEDAELPLTLHAGGILKNSIAKLENVSFAYPGEGNPTLFAGVDMNLDSKSRVCLLGENGEGKTTLVKTMLGELQPTAGQVTLDRGARVALVNQHHAEQLQYDMTPLAFMIDKFPGDGSYRHEQDVRGHLSGCGIPNAQQVVPSGALSGGQRSRVAMAAVSFSKPHLLVLDEPTNNLDLEAVAALADAVESFAGGVVLVSHDQYFVGRVAKEIFVVGGGRVSQMESFAAYKKAIAKDMAV